MWYPFAGNTNNVVIVIVNVTNSTADVYLQWLHQQPIYPTLIQVFCSANMSCIEMILCGNTRDVQEKLLIKDLKPNVTYYYKLEASGDQPFAVQGNFTTMPLGRFLLQFVTLDIILRVCLQHR